MRYYLLTSAKRQYPCDVCGAKFPTLGALTSHKRWSHDL
ncbi:C2H2-type zinc finger protein [Nocardia sp. NPDC004860]